MTVHWFSVENSAPVVSPRSTPSTAVVRIFDTIGEGGVSAADFVAELDGITAPALHLMINSSGGDVFDGLAIFHALRAHPAAVTTFVEGIAASAASVIALAGDEVVMGVGSMMMIHDAVTLTYGNAADMTAAANILDAISTVLSEVYAARAGADPESWRALMRSETWFTADEAVAAGLAHRVDR